MINTATSGGTNGHVPPVRRSVATKPLAPKRKVHVARPRLDLASESQPPGCEGTIVQWARHVIQVSCGAVHGKSPASPPVQTAQTSATDHTCYHTSAVEVGASDAGSASTTDAVNHMANPGTTAWERNSSPVRLCLGNKSAFSTPISPSSAGASKPTPVRRTLPFSEREVDASDATGERAHLLFSSLADISMHSDTILEHGGSVQTQIAANRPHTVEISSYRQKEKEFL